MNRNSQQEQDAVTWQPVALRLGELGLDLRGTASPLALTKLLNARFEADRIVRRNGYTGIRVQSTELWPVFASGPGAVSASGWVYGHGQQIDSRNAGAIESMDLPATGIARGTFKHVDSDVVWTGDRLFTVRHDGDQAVGYSDFWGGIFGHRGLPAYLPQQVDSSPPDAATGNYVETCLTETQRVVAWATTSGVTATINDRATGAVIDRTSFGSAAALDMRLFVSGQYVVCVWRDTNNDMNISRWSGLTWTAASLIAATVASFDVALVSGGFHLLWRTGSTIKIGRYSNASAQAAPYAFGAALTVSGVPNGPVALGVAPDGVLCVAWQDTAGLQAKVFSAGLATVYAQAQLSNSTWTAVTVCSRGLKGGPSGVPEANYRWLVHAAQGNPATSVYALEFLSPNSPTRQMTRFNSTLASKSFRVGDEVFCWLRSLNSSTLYLCGGISGVGVYTQVAGIADREEAAARVVSGTVQATAMVTPDPLEAHRFTWARPYLTGQDYSRGGNVRIGDLDFTPQFCAVQYGKSVYLAGSHVRCYDGVELGDAGFHDFPLVSSSSQTTGGALTLTGTYQFRVYPVRYNRHGERFMGAAITYPAPQLTGSNTKYTLTIKTLPVTNHSDVVFEVYRTQNLGTTFYYEGSVANSLTAATVTFDSTLSDGVVGTKPGDSHETGVASLDEVEEFGPIGCAILAADGDRLWGAGGQVPPGYVQFSKLKENNEGVGFDELNSTQQVDVDGGEITSIANFSDGRVIFERDKAYVLFGGGPDNYGNGSFSTPQLVLADGAINHVGTCVTQLGILFWGVDGPRLLTPAFKVENLSDPVRPLTEQMSPSGVQADLVRREVVWFTKEGDAVLFNYAGQGPRWAQWSGLKIAGCSESALVTTNGVLLTEDVDAIGDNAVPFAFAGSTGEIDLERLLLGRTQIREVGVVGRYLGPHSLRLRIFYNGAPMWTDQWVWHPTTNTWLQSVDDVGGLTPVEVDALNAKDQSGKYVFHKKTSRHECTSVRVEWSDIAAFRPTYQIDQLVFELGAVGGLGRLPASTFTRS